MFPITIPALTSVFLQYWFEQDDSCKKKSLKLKTAVGTMREVIFPARLVPAQRPCPCLSRDSV